MKNTPLRFFFLLGSLVLVSAIPAFAQDTTYVWQSADGDPFNIQGTIVLDSPSSANGSGSDVVSLTITDSVDTFSWNPETSSLWLSPASPFSWDSAQILQMDIESQGGPRGVLAQFEVPPDGNGKIFDFSVLQPPAQAPADFNGEWVAATTVPEPSAFYLLFVGSSTALFAQWRKRQSL